MAGRGPKYSREEDIALLRFEKHDGQKLRSREEVLRANLPQQPALVCQRCRAGIPELRFC